MKAGVERGDGARDLSHENGEAECEPEADAAADVAHEDGGVSNGSGEQEDERNVHTQLDAEKSAEGD